MREFHARLLFYSVMLRDELSLRCVSIVHIPIHHPLIPDSNEQHFLSTNSHFNIDTLLVARRESAALLLVLVLLQALLLAPRLAYLIIRYCPEFSKPTNPVLYALRYIKLNCAAKLQGSQ